MILQGKKKYIFGGIVVAVLSSLLTVIALVLLLNLNVQKTVDLVRFFATKRFIESQYVDSVDDVKLMDGAISGMVKALGDPHSLYLDPSMYRKLQDHTSGSFGGIGVVMGFKDHKVTVMSVMDGTPGQAAGIQPEDEIVAVDGVLSRDIEPEDVAMRIRGEIGTEVVLRIRRQGEEDKDYTIQRSSIHLRTAAEEMLPEGIGYIRIASFSEKTGQEFRESYDRLEEQGMRGLIIDLRANPGGLITSCVEIANMVVPLGPIVSVVQRDCTREEHDSKLVKSKYPIVVLIDGNSASASEILAGALQDTKAATLVGTQSYGKGSVQVVIPMNEGDALKLTIAKYYTPSGRSIDGVGIEPDVKVDMDPKAQQDVQLAKAIEVMQGKLQ